ncbi:MAG: TonB-dependent receptor [Cytophagales bacterium]|nr:TonB-dependent receptor [Cytophagales bacterium]
MRLLLAIALLMSLSGFAQTTQVLEGKVVAEEGPIPGATIRILDTDFATVTDVAGVFRISDIPNGSYKIEIRSVGFKSQIIDIYLNKNIIDLAVEMEESTLDMDAVVVTGTMQPTFVTQSPIKVDVITSKHLNTYIPMAASSIVEGITLVNGVQEVVACGVCFTNSISINGLPGPYTAILMDGTPIYGNLASVYGLNGIPSMIIDRFEVIKGPSSTLYGSEAVAGVINIITKDPEGQPLVAADVMATSHRESFGNFAVAPKIGKSKGFIGLNYAFINDFTDRNDDGFGDNINLDRISLFSKWNIHRRSGKQFSIAAKYYYEDRRNGVAEFLRDRNYRTLRGSDQIYGESIYTNRFEVFGSYELPVSENIKIDYSLSGHDQNSFYGSDFYEAQQQIAFANLVWNKRLKDHHLTSGFTSRYQSYDDNTVATESEINSTVVNDPDRQYIPGIFAQDEWEINPRFTVLAGARLDHYKRHGLIAAPRLNLKVDLNEWTSLRSNFGTGFRVVNLFTEDHAFITGQREVVIAEELNPEESYNASLNLNHVFVLGPIQGMIDIDAFYTYFTNKIIPDYENPTQIIYANAAGHAVSRGIGFNVNSEFTFPLSVNIGMNFQDVTETEPDGNGINQTRNIEFAPNWTGILTANYQFKKEGLSLAYTWRSTGPMTLPEVFDLDATGNPLADSRATISEAFVIHNLQITKTLGAKFSLYGGVQNIFDFVQPGSPLIGFNDPNANPGFSDSFDTSYAFAPIHGREFYIGLNWSLK